MAKKEKIYLTQESYAQYTERLKFLQEVARPQVIEEIKEARNQGDLSENAEYDSARDKQAAIENEILEIQHILENYEIIKAASSATVHLGKIIIVGSLDADPFSGKISNTSPLARALIGRKVEDVVEVEAPKKYKIKILSIK